MTKAQAFQTLGRAGIAESLSKGEGGACPAGIDHWIGLVEKWDKSYDRQKARDLVDRLVTAIGDRPAVILDRLFASLEQQVCHHF